MRAWKQAGGLLLTAMSMIAAATYVAAMNSLVRDSVLGGRLGSGVVIIALLSLLALATMSLLIRLLRRGFDPVIAFAAFVQLLLPDVFGVVAGWEFLTRLPRVPVPFVV